MSNPLEHLGDKYEVLEPLRQGGMGAIYKVRHKFLDHVRVVKVLHANLNEQGEFQERFAREARLATKVRHPNIAEVYDFSIKEGTAFLVMEFIEGVNFAQLLEAGGPPEIEQTLEICIQSLKALGHLHDRSLVHRDISPDNLMLSQDDLGRPLVKLIDLGIVKPLAEDTTLTKTGLFMGKLSYASPEQFGQGEEGVDLDQRSDLYSFGVVLYQMLTGELPFTGSESSVIAGHLFHPPRDFARTDAEGKIPDSLRKTVLRSLEKKPGDRWQTAAQFAEALKADGNPAGVTAVETELPKPSSVPASEDRTAAVPQQTSANANANANALLAGAERLAQLEQLDEARGQLEIVLSIDPHNKKAQQLLRRVCDTQLAPLMGEASQLLITGSFEKAVERLNRAIEIDPKNESVARLLEEAKVGVEEVRQKEAFAKALEGMERDVRAALAEDRPDDAGALLEQAKEQFSQEAVYARLRREVESAKQAQVEQRIARFQSRAASAMASRQFAEAVEILEEAIEIAPEHPGVNGKLEEARRGVAEAEQQEKARAVAHALTDIQAALNAADFDSAGELLAETKASGVEDASLQAKMDDLERQLQTEVERRRAVDRFRDEIEGLVSSQDVDAARHKLDLARAETDRVTVFADLADQIDGLAKERERLQLTETARQIDELIDNRQLSEARLELSKALRSYPDAEEIQDLNTRIEKAEAEIADAERAETARRLTEALQQASAALGEGDFDKARQAVATAQEVEPENAEARALAEKIEATVKAQGEIEVARNEATQLAEKKEYAKAAKVLRQAFRAHPGDSSLEEMLTEVETALEQHRRATQQQSRLAFLLESAEKLAEEGRFEKAIESLEQAQKLDVEDPQVQQRLEALRAQLSERAEFSAKQEQADELVQHAGKLVEEGDLPAAREAAAKALELIGDEGQAAAMLARIDEQIEAARVEEEAAQERTEKVSALLSKAGELEQGGDLDAAAAALDEALAIDPEHADAGARRQALTESIAQAAAEEKRRLAQEEEKRQAEEAERQRKAAEEEARRAAQEEKQRQAEEEKLRAEEQARKAAEEEERQAAEEEKRRAAEEEERKAAEEKERKAAAEKERRAAEKERKAAEKEKQRQAKEEKRQAAAAQKRVDQATRLIDAGELAKAQAEVEQALQANPGDADATRLSENIQELLLAAEAEQVAAEVGEEAIELGTTVVRHAEDLGEAVPPPPPEAATEAATAAEVPVQVEPSVMASGQASSSGSKKGLMIGAAALAVVAVVVVVMMMGGDDSAQQAQPEQAATQPATSDTPPAPRRDSANPATGESEPATETPEDAVSDADTDPLAAAGSGSASEEAVSAGLSQAQAAADDARREARAAQAPELVQSAYEAAERTFDRAVIQVEAGDAIGATSSLRSSARMFEEATSRAQEALAGQASSPGEDRIASRSGTEDEVEAPNQETRSQPTPTPVKTVETRTVPETPAEQPAAAPSTSAPATEAPTSTSPREQTPTPVTDQPASAQTADPPVTEPPPPSPQEILAGRETLSPAQEIPLLEQLMKDYAKAYESLKVSSVKRYWPSLSGQQLQAIEGSFDVAKSIKMKLEGCRFTFSGTTATGLCIQEQTLRPKKGRAVDGNRPVEVLMKKENGRWIIVDM